MRGIILSLWFFFAPVILMFAMRYLVILLRIWTARRENADVIDITPGKPHPPSRSFIAFAVLVGLVCFALVWMRLDDKGGNPQGTYIPAHIDAHGHLVPGRIVKP
jgi:hypothetical protein